MNANPIIRRNPGRSFKTWELCGGGFVLDGLPKKGSLCIMEVFTR